MAYDKVIDSSVLDAGLKQIADAIREKGGTTDSLAFPQAMADAIAAIEAGGNIDFGDFLKIDAIQTGKVVTTNEKRFVIDKPSSSHVPRLYIVYSEDDVNTLSGSLQITVFAFGMTTAPDIKIDAEDGSFVVMLGSTSNSIVHNIKTASGRNRSAGSACFNTINSAYNGLADVNDQLYIGSFEGSTSSSQKKYFAVGAEYKYLIGYEVV